MSASPPLPCRWDGECFTPSVRFQRLADKYFVVGEIYPLAVEEQRSSNSHRHYFSCIAEAWANLPDRLATEYHTPEHLRKRALIETGWHDERRFVASSPAEARRIAAFLRGDEYAVLAVNGAILIERRAKSQSQRAMPKGDFQRSKDAVLDYLAKLIGVTAKELAANAEKSA